MIEPVVGLGTGPCPTPGNVTVLAPGGVGIAVPVRVPCPNKSPILPNPPTWSFPGPATKPLSPPPMSPSKPNRPAWSNPPPDTMPLRPLPIAPAPRPIAPATLPIPLPIALAALPIPLPTALPMLPKPLAIGPSTGILYRIPSISCGDVFCISSSSSCSIVCFVTSL